MAARPPYLTDLARARGQPYKTVWQRINRGAPLTIALMDNYQEIKQVCADLKLSVDSVAYCLMCGLSMYEALSLLLGGIDNPIDERKLYGLLGCDCIDLDRVADSAAFNRMFLSYCYNASQLHTVAPVNRVRLQVAALDVIAQYLTAPAPPDSA